MMMLCKKFWATQFCKLLSSSSNKMMHPSMHWARGGEHHWVHWVVNAPLNAFCFDLSGSDADPAAEENLSMSWVIQM